MDSLNQMITRWGGASSTCWGAGSPRTRSAWASAYCGSRATACSKHSVALARNPA